MSNSSSRGGIGFFGLLGIIFITLKLMGYIAWPWVWVLAPLWGPLALGLSILLVTVIVSVVAAIIVGTAIFLVEISEKK